MVETLILLENKRKILFKLIISIQMYTCFFNRTLWLGLYLCIKFSLYLSIFLTWYSILFAPYSCISGNLLFIWKMKKNRHVYFCIASGKIPIITIPGADLTNVMDCVFLRVAYFLSIRHWRRPVEVGNGTLHRFRWVLWRTWWATEIYANCNVLLGVTAKNWWRSSLVGRFEALTSDFR